MNESVNQATDEYAGRLSDEATHDEVIAQLAAFVRVLARSPRLAKAFSDADVPLEAKRALLDDLARDTLGSLARHGVMQLVMSDRRSTTSLVEHATDWLARVLFGVAERNQRLDVVQAQLHQVAELIGRNHALRDALENPGIPDSSKEALVVELFTSAVDSAVVELLRLLVAASHGRDVDTRAEQLSRLAATRRDRVVADVQTAVELDDERRARLTAKLSEVIGKIVEPRFFTDPSIVGSVVVRIGDDVLDGSVRHRLDQARFTVVGAS